MMRVMLLARKSGATAALLAGVLVAACGGGASPGGGLGPTTAATAAPTATVASAPTATATLSSPAAATPVTGAVTVAALVAIGEQVYPKTPDGAAYIECSNGGNAYANCPITDRLKQRLQQAMVTLCRCQNPADTRTVTADLTPTGGVIHVGYGTQRFDLVAVLQGGRLLVDDQRCQGGGAATSIYSDFAPC